MSNIFTAKYVPFAADALFTTPDAPGRSIEQSFGMVAVFSEGGFSSNASSLQGLSDALLAQAVQLGGNAVISARFDSVIGSVFLYGTAVRLSH